mgnify:CR=1 FL=1
MVVVERGSGMGKGMRTWRIAGIVLVWMMGVLAMGAITVKAEPGAWELGAQAGWDVANGDESFVKYDVYGTRGLPWNWQWGQALQVDTHLTAAASLLDAGGDNGLIGSLGLELVFGSASGESPFQLRTGAAVSLLSEVEIGEEDFGGPVQFTLHIGSTYRVWDNLRAVVQLQHMSNAGMYSKNPGTP